MKNLLQILFVFYATAAFSQKAEIEVVALELAYEEFPEVRCKNNFKVTEKINTFLQLGELKHIPTIYKNNPFEKVALDTNTCCSSVTFYSWKKNKSPQNTLSLSIDKEGCGAYCENYTTYYNFDTRTGNKLVLKDIFLDVGSQKLQKALHSRIKAKIDTMLVFLKNSLLNESIEDVEVLNKEIDIYQNCFYYHNEPSLDYIRWELQDTKMIFTMDRCSNHAMRGLDELGDFSIAFPYKEIEEYLSEYGKNLLTGEKALTTNNPEGKMFKGKINAKYPITAIIEKIDSDKSVSMYYWYDRVKLSIECYGKYEKNHFSLKEYDGQYTQIAIIEANWDDNKIIGTWKKDNAEAFSFELYEY